MAKRYARSTKKVSTATKYSGTYGQNPAMDARAMSTGINLKKGDTYSFTGISSKRIPKSNGRPMGMTYGGTIKGKGATKKVKRARA
jgi:hypothetical protein